ncbi:hypothetical protein [Candidiatus Paracoxiella cheracis]|uniref:hypothetical protein n=1 Tax=Candidiatus Paracoxiella cheracis TaxID=3405120 RepID=UPI003BF53354
MKKLFINFGEGVRVFHQGHEILKLIFGVDEVFQKIEIINISVAKEVEVKKGVVESRR